MGLGGPQAWLLGLPTAVVYGSLALFISVLHNVFLLYYVDTFVSVYKISKAAFWVGEVGPCWGGSWADGRAGSLPARSLGQAGLPTETQQEKLELEAWVSPPWGLYQLWPLSYEPETVLCIHIC